MAQITKGCPRCGADLARWPNRKGGVLVCTREGCKHKERLPVDLVLRHQGAMPLPGLVEAVS